MADGLERLTNINSVDGADLEPEFDEAAFLASPELAKYIDYLEGNDRWLTLETFWEELTPETKANFSLAVFAERVTKEGVYSIALYDLPQESFPQRPLQKILKMMAAERVDSLRNSFTLAVDRVVTPDLQKPIKREKLVDDGLRVISGRTFVTTREFIRRHRLNIHPSVLLSLIDAEIGDNYDNVVITTNTTSGLSVVVFDELLAMQALAKRFGSKAESKLGLVRYSAHALALTVKPHRPEEYLTL